MMQKSVLFFTGFLMLFCAIAAGYALFVTSGSSWIVQKALAYYSEPKNVSFETASGSLAKGLTLKGVILESPRKFLPIQKIQAGELRIDLSSDWKKKPFLVKIKNMTLDSQEYFQSINIQETIVDGDHFLAKGIAVRAPNAFEEMRIQSAQGNQRSLRLSDIQAKGLSFLTRPHVLDVQALQMEWPLEFKNIKKIENGRLSFDTSDTILFYGTQENGAMDFQIYSKNIHIQDALALYYRKDLIRNLSGEIEDAEISLRGTTEAIEISGKFKIDKLVYKKFSLTAADVPNFNLHVKTAQKNPECHGKVSVMNGQIQHNGTLIHLEPSQILFSGDSENPTLDIHAYSYIHETRISIYLRDSLQKPDLRLTSDPSWPEEKILVMLATGKEWSGSEKAMREGKVSADAAKEFLDYFVFGGSVEKLSKRLGLKEVSLTAEEGVKGIGVKKAMSEKIDVGYGIEKQSGQTEKGALTQKMGADYKISSSTVVSVEGKAASKNHEQDKLNGQDLGVDKSLTMKVKRSF